jgi:murein DD-endopeptidase MepM/ murein hydrolase activator NlpD
MTDEANARFGKQTGNTRLHAIEVHRQELSPTQSLDYISTTPTSTNLITSHLDHSSNPGFASLQSAQSVPIGYVGAIEQAVQGATEQVQRVLTDQVTPLRLAGHLSVLVIAAVVLVLSQITIPEWELSLEPTPVAANIGGFSGGAAQRESQSFTVMADFGSDTLKPNTVLNFVDKTAGNTTAATAQEAPLPEVRYYTVKSGDTVLGIAQRYGLQPETLMWSNSFIEENPDRLKIGDQVRILPVDGVLHVVKPGDTLSSIASKYETDMQSIVEYVANGMGGASDTLPIGKEIVVPGGSKPYVAVTVGGASTAYSVERPSGALAGSGNFSWPSAGYVSQGYWRGHPAIDLAGWLGAPVTASDAGYVVLAGGGWNGGYGNHVIIDHGNGFTTMYAHLNSIFVKPGETVSRGQQVGTMGNTGNSTGPHLHFEIRYDGVPYNPSSYLK